MSDAPRQSWSRLRASRAGRRRAMGYRRLRGDVQTFRHEFAVRPHGSAVRQEVESLLDLADDEAGRRSLASAFAALNAARRVAVHAYDLDGLVGAAITLRSEAKGQKLSTWRREAMLRLLAPVLAGEGESLDGGSTETCESARESDEAGDLEARGGDASGRRDDGQLAGWQARVQAAMEIRDEGLQAPHRKRTVLTTSFVTLTAVIVVGVLALWASGSEPPGAGEGWIVVFLFGLLGGCVSAGSRLGKQNVSRTVPEALRTRLSIAFLPVFGGAAAIGAVALLDSGLIQDANGTDTVTLGVAFLAGFSERFVSGLADVGRD